jgi:hypothetical protein
MPPTDDTGVDTREMSVLSVHAGEKPTWRSWLASAAVGIAKVLFFIFVVVFIVLLVLGFMRRRTT